MKVYSIFDDFTEEAAEIIRKAGAELTVHPRGVPRPDHDEMKAILKAFDCVIIGTSQKITGDMFDGIESRRIIATASVGMDHIQIPEEKKTLVSVVNTPEANAQSVAEYTIGCALFCVKRLAEGRALYLSGKDNKKLFQKPEDLNGRTLGVIGAGNISRRIMACAAFFNMDVLCWTAHPEKHPEVLTLGARFSELQELVKTSDVISVNLPNNAGTRGLVSEGLVSQMKDSCVFISVSRSDTVDYGALFKKAAECPGFYVCLDLDPDSRIIEAIPDQPNVLVTPHIAGGTLETRKRMFCEAAEAASALF